MIGSSFICELGFGGAFGSRLLRLAVLVFGLVAASPAGAFSGADLLSDLCVATYPSFDAAAARIASLHNHAVTYDGRLFEQLDAKRRLSWTVTDDPGATVDRFLVDIAWGTLNSRPAASCVVADKKGFGLAELAGKLTVKHVPIHPKKPMFAAVADAVVERPDGKRLWLTLSLAPGHDDPAAGAAISVATLMSSAYLNALMEKDP